jgi:hypothetical protein
MSWAPLWAPTATNVRRGKGMTYPPLYWTDRPTRPTVRKGRPASNGPPVGMSPATPSCASVFMPPPVAPVRSAQRAPRPKMRRANSPSAHKSSTRRSKPHGTGRRPLSSRPSTPGGPGLKARTRRPSGGVAYANVATSATPKHSCSTSAPPRRSTWCEWRHGGRGGLGPAHDDPPLRPSGHRWSRERSMGMCHLDEGERGVAASDPPLL